MLGRAANGRPTNGEHLSIPAERRHHFRGRLGAAAALALVLVPLLLTLRPTAVRAAGAFVVNTIADGHDAVPGDTMCNTAVANSVCTLRAAVEEANFFGLSSTIIFSVNGVFTLTLGELHVSGSPAQTLQIIGNGSSNTIIDGNGTSRVMDIDSGATVTMSGVTIQHGNVAPQGRADSGDGGGVRNAGTLNLSDSSILSNVASGFGGGGLSNDGVANLTNVIVDGNQATRTNPAASVGGGIDTNNSLTFTNGIVSNNVAASGGSDGGGIQIDSGTASLMNLDIHHNTAGNGGGLADDSNGGSRIVDVTLRSNHAVGALPFKGGGGGLYYSLSGGTDTLVNATVDGNDAAVSGGGIYGEDGALSISSTTIANNAASASGGGVFAGGHVFVNVRSYRGTVALQYTIVSANSPTNCATTAGGTITSHGQNIDNGSSCGFAAPSDKPNTDPLLLELANNPGPNAFVPPTHALRANSPAVDFTPAGSCPPPATDERGVQRPQGATCDSGAFELETSTPLPNVPEFPPAASGVALIVVFAGSLGALRRLRRRLE